jgi:tRNA wybutosine-synthesizing protein 3
MELNFLKQKQKYLADLTAGKLDKSKKGFIDDEIKALVDAINDHQDYYTTSSCSGRILLYSTTLDRKKNETEWLFVSHTRVAEEDIRKVLSGLPVGIIFFRFEPLILHVACKELAAAERLLQFCNNAGLKHSGAISLGERIIVEIVGNDRLDAPIAVDQKLLVTSEGISHFVADANEKMKRNFERMKRFKQCFETTESTSL